VVSCGEFYLFLRVLWVFLRVDQAFVVSYGRVLGLSSGFMPVFAVCFGRVGRVGEGKANGKW
jgi:hypothetical protein